MILHAGVITLLCVLAFTPGVSQSVGGLSIQGTVLDSQTREALVGATIRISSTSLGTQTDLSGRFGLQIPHANLSDTLIITFVGYKKFLRTIQSLMDGDELEVLLHTDVVRLKEVVVRSDFWKKQYTPEELKEDYTKFFTIMEKFHTGLFDYLPEHEWLALKDSSMRMFKYPMSHSEFYRLIALHVGKVRNMHTRHGVTDWWYKQKQNIFPFNIHYFDNRMYILEPLVDNLKFERGCEILEVNGKTPAEMKRMILPYIPADGYNQTGREASLNDFFPWYFSLFVEEADQFTIRIKDLKGEEITVTSPGLRDSFSHLSLQQLWKWRKSALELKIDQQLNTAYFRIEDSRVFKDSISQYFKRIVDSKIQNLIIDLRGSGGIREEEQVAELYSYLVAKPFRVYEAIQVKSNDYTLFDRDFTFKPYGKSLKHIKEAYFDRLVDSGNGYYYWQQESYLGLIQPAHIQFSGAVYILTDGRNYSASTDFTSLASQLQNVSIIGEETGGEYRSYISGAMFGLVLPNSKIGVKIPTWKSILAIPEDPSNSGRGVIPDYPVSISLEDFIHGTDAAKDFVYELIARKAAQN